MLDNKNIIVGVSGGIAAYKACDIVSRLKKQNANVDVIMTKSATEFVTPLTFQSLSQNPVVVSAFDNIKYWEVQHIALAKKADAFIIAPATANIIGKIANGIADDMLSTTIMATKAPVLFAPAMNTNMYENVIVKRNIQILSQYGYNFISPNEGRLACGDIGRGKMAEPSQIVEEIIKLFAQKKDLEGKTVLVTAGPTREAIDPVRYISNHSTGKMGYAIAKKASIRGANVILISGPTNLEVPKGVTKVEVSSAIDMYNACMDYLVKSDIIIKSAAVADFTPIHTSEQKIKKSDEEIVLKLKKNPDILYEIGKRKENKVLVGFAMETEDLIQNAKTKLSKKNLDFIVANDLKTEGAGFGTDTNVVKIIDKTGRIDEIQKISKLELADIILDKIVDLIH